MDRSKLPRFRNREVTAAQDAAACNRSRHGQQPCQQGACNKAHHGVDEGEGEEGLEAQDGVVVRLEHLQSGAASSSGSGTQHEPGVSTGSRPTTLTAQPAHSYSGNPAQPTWYRRRHSASFTSVVRTSHTSPVPAVSGVGPQCFMVAAYSKCGYQFLVLQSAG